MAFHNAIVVAVAKNGVIGKENDLPWRLPEDLKHFKATTMGHPLVMGRLTFESLGRPLPGRTNIVVTRQRAWRAEGVSVVHDLATALTLAQDVARAGGMNQTMIIGGAQLYQEALPCCSRLYLTEVHAEIEGDAYFPDWNRDQWEEVSRADFFADSGNPYDYSFVLLERRRN